MHEKPGNSDKSAATSAVATEMSDMASSPSTANTCPGPESDMSQVDTTCGICLEAPTKFGLMVNCSHVFCLCTFCPQKAR